MKETKQKTTKKSLMSPFCESLMKSCGEIIESRTLEDAAIVICTDGKTVASRQCGLTPNALRMLYSKMKSNDEFAELIMRVSTLYSKDLLGKRNNESNTESN